MMEMVADKARRIYGRLVESRTVLPVAGITVVGATILLLFAMGRTYPPSAFLAAFTVLVAAALLIPLVLRLSREEGQ